MQNKILALFNEHDISYEIINRVSDGKIFIQAIILNTNRRKFLSDVFKTFFKFDDSTGFFILEDYLFITIKDIDDSFIDANNFNTGQKILMNNKDISHGICVNKNVSMTIPSIFFKKDESLKRLVLHSKKKVNGNNVCYEIKKDDAKIQISVEG